MEIVQWALAGGVMVGALVVIHEFGHFLVARLFGVGTPVFSFGIGPRVWGVDVAGTDFRLSLLPIGGYVQMAGADPFGEEDSNDWPDPAQDFMRKPVWQRLLIMLAGPAMNLALPFVLFTSVAMLGEPVSDNKIGSVFAGSPAAEVGLRADDRIVSVDGQPVAVWNDVLRAVDRAEGPIAIAVDRAGEQVSVTLPEPSSRMGRMGRTDELGFDWLRPSSVVGVPDPRSPAGRAGIRSGDAILEVDGTPVSTWYALEAALAAPGEPGGAHEVVRVRAVDGALDRATLTLAPDPTWQFSLVATDAFGLEPGGTYVGVVDETSAAHAGGIRPGDRILAIDGTPVGSWPIVLELVGRTTEGGSTKPRELHIDLIREGVRVSLALTPTYTRQVIGPDVTFRPIMGVRQLPDMMVTGDVVRKYYAFGEAAARATDQTWELFSQTGQVLWKFLTRERQFSETVGGPVAIFRAAGESAEGGIFPFVRMMGMISLSLGIVNLLPIPVLDGGQILFYLYEAVRGRQLPQSWRERIQMVGVLVLAAVFLVAFVNDMSSWLGG